MPDAPAKLTLSLRVTGVRADGYHEIDAVMVSVSRPHDVVTLTPADAISLTVHGQYASGVPADDRNLAGGEKSKPVRLVAGTGDPSSRMSKAILEFEARMVKAGYKNVTAAIYTDARHETLNETIRDEATADIVAWIDSVL